MSPRRLALGLTALAIALTTFTALPDGAPVARAEQSESSVRRAAAASIAGGAVHTCLITTAGDVRCWGEGSGGRLGYGNPERIGDTETPASIGNVPLGGKATAITAGEYHTCALLVAATVRCWGIGSDGRLGYGNGNGNIGDDKTPASAGNVPLGGRATAVSAGGHHTCAILTTGDVRCWGNNSRGQLGYGNTHPIGDTDTPASAGNVPLGGKATAISAGFTHTCAILTTGDVRCWGEGLSGQLGYGSIERVGDTETPASFGNVPLGGKATAISAGGEHTCAILTTGDVRCWGYGAHGRLGYGNTDDIGDSEPPTSVDPVSLGGRATAITAGGNHTCAILTTGHLRCWGQGNIGQLGYGNPDPIGDNEMPADAGNVPLGSSATAISAGNHHTCAVLPGGAIRCWGHGDQGQLGYGAKTRLGDTGATVPALNGPVPTGVLARTRAATRTTLAASKKRDRRAPYRYALRGRVSGVFAPDAATCQGTVTVVLKRRSRRLKAARVALRPDCTYRAKLVVKKRKLRTQRKVKLKVTATYSGSINLTASARRIKLKAN